jgi:GcrA cell cycle regulator
VGILSIWTDERIEKLTELWKDGWSASQIAKVVGGTRGGVLGKIHRLHLPSRPKKLPMLTPRIRRVKIASYRQLPFLHTEAIVPTEPRKVTLLELEENMCRWPLGDPKSEAFRYCGLDKHPDHISYCVGHAALSYRAPQLRAARTCNTQPTALS